MKLVATLFFLIVFFPMEVLAADQDKVFRMPASEEATQAIESTQVIVLMDNQEIIATFKPTHTHASMAIAALPGVGLLGAIIAGGTEGAVNAKVNSDKAQQSEKNVAPIKSALQGYSFPEAFKREIATQLGTVDWLKLTEIRFDSPKTKMEDLKNGMAETSFLLIHTKYSFSEDLKYFRIWCSVVLLPNNEKLKAIAVQERPDDKLNRLYRNEIMYIDSLGVAAADLDETAAKWGENNGQRIRASLADGIAQVSGILANDLRKLSQPSEDIGSKASVKTVRYSGDDVELVAETERHVTIRRKNGTLRTLSRDLIDPEKSP